MANLTIVAHCWWYMSTLKQISPNPVIKTNQNIDQSKLLIFFTACQLVFYICHPIINNVHINVSHIMPGISSPEFVQISDIWTVTDRSTNQCNMHTSTHSNWTGLSKCVMVFVLLPNYRRGFAKFQLFS